MVQQNLKTSGQTEHPNTSTQARTSFPEHHFITSCRCTVEDSSLNTSLKQQNHKEVITVNLIHVTLAKRRMYDTSPNMSNNEHSWLTLP